MKRIFILIILFAVIEASVAQDIIYADVNKADAQRMNFEILGRIANNYLIYKEIKGKNRISVYDESMHLLEEVPVNLPKRDQLLDLSFFSGNRSANMIYQHQAGNIVYITASKLEANGRMLEEPKILDTTSLNYTAESKIYNTLSSEDGSRIILFKIRRNRANGQYDFSTR